jgi:benzoyl-CoA reductase/2-hydroxyglutaryl-CoA dehydratase subunit BcrC/BadD/HgdB
MAECCGGKPPPEPKPSSACGAAKPAASVSTPCCGGTAKKNGISPRFSHMLDHALAYVQQAKAEGRPVVGILCEFTPREVIMAAGGVPICLCGGSAATIPVAETRLPANLCPLIKSTFGYHLSGANPFLELCDLVVAETTCDGKKKMYELMAETRPMHVLELPQKPDDAVAAMHWIAEVRKLKEALEKRFATGVSDERLHAAIEVMNRERGLRRRLAELMAEAAPPLTGRELLDLKSLVAGIPCDLAEYERLLAVLPGRTPPAAPGAVRVMLTGVPLPHGAERVLDLIEGAGALVVCQENCTGVKPVLEDVETGAADPLAAIAAKYFHLPCSVMTPNRERLVSLKALAARYRPQAVIELVWQACLTYDVEAHAVKRLCDSELHLPYLRLGTDYSPTDSARLTVRIEALCESVRGAVGDPR